MVNETEKMKGIVGGKLRNGEYVSLLMELMGEHIKKAGRKIDRESVNRLVEEILKANAIFLMGAGRSGLVARAFAMRLMHLGLKVYVVGETTTPAVKSDDLVIAISGSGETRSIVSLARIAKEEIGAKLATITSNSKSSLAKLSDIVIVVEGKKVDDVSNVDYLERHMMGMYTKLTPLGTMFEITSLILLDSIIAELIARTGASEEELKARHSTLE